MCYDDFPYDNSDFFNDGDLFIKNLTNLNDLLYNKILNAYPPEIGKN